MGESRATIKSPELLEYLDHLAKMGIYGARPGAVATWIVRKEVMRLVEAGVLKPIPGESAKAEKGEPSNS